MKKIIVVALAALALTGCGSDLTSYPQAGVPQTANPTSSYQYEVTVQDVRLADNRVVTCIFERNHGTMSCDWEHVK